MRFFHRLQRLHNIVYISFCHIKQKTVIGLLFLAIFGRAAYSIIVGHYVKSIIMVGRSNVGNIKLGFVGTGNMASAMLHTLLDRKLLPPENITVFDPDPKRMAPFLTRGVTAAVSNQQLVTDSLLIVLAVKPQVMGAVLADISIVSGGRYFVSIAAGLTTKYIRQRLDPTARVVRVLPNTPLLLSNGATVIAKDDDLPPELLSMTESLFATMGTVSLLPEDKLNEVIGVSGSSPAFFFRMAHVMALAAEEQGIAYEQALNLVAKTMEGSARMLMKPGSEPVGLIAQVASPGGTTMAALQSLDEDNFDDALRNAMRRCTTRAYELGQE